MDRSRRLNGEVALVTGGAGGVGEGIVLALAAEGCHVIVNYLDGPDAAERVAAEAREFDVQAITMQGDVRRTADVDRMVADICTRLGSLTILVNNAGIQTWVPLLDMSDEEWDAVIETNLRGCFLGTRSAGRAMKANGRGSIVNIGSGSNKVPFPGLASYTASKGGIEMFTKVSAAELGRFGIRVNCIAPGAVEVERTRKELPDYAGQWGAVTPLGRVGFPADVGRAVAMVCGPDAAFITGQTIWVDGGLFTQPPWPGKT
jgi:3-oxoacyl-[acyl-carrier protein] reductase